MLVALSTIGPTEYKIGNYQWGTEAGEIQVCCTDLFPIAVDAFFNPDELLLIVTSEAKNHKNYQKIEQALQGKLRPVSVPLGKSEGELWQIFDLIADAVPENARVILDVTHAFRSLPLVIFGVINYLRFTKGVTLERIVYGAFDASKAGSGEAAVVPVFDLTIMIKLQEWLHAVEDFHLRCEGEKLAKLLEDAQGRQWSSGQGKKDELPRRLKNMGRHMRDFSRSVRLLRPLEALNSAAQALELAEEIEQEAERWAKPFKHMLSRIAQELKPLAAGGAGSLDKPFLRSQLSLVRHFLKKGLVVQAVLMEREWLVSWLVWRANFGGSWRDKNVRREMEEAMGRAAQHLYRDGLTEASPPEWYKKLPEADTVTKLWNELTNLRNDLAHCAMNDSPAAPDSIMKRAEDMAKELEQLIGREKS